MIWPFRKSYTDINPATATLSPFISAALSDLKSEDIHNQGDSRTLAECYVYGAIRYLASYDDMHPVSTGFLVTSMFASYFDADSNDVNQFLKLCSEVKDGDKEKLFMMEGAGALRRWLVCNDRTVASNLKDLIDISG